MSKSCFEFRNKLSNLIINKKIRKNARQNFQVEKNMRFIKKFIQHKLEFKFWMNIHGMNVFSLGLPTAY